MNMYMNIQNALKVKVVNKSKFALPIYQTEGSSGVDVKCDLSRLDINKLFDAYTSLNTNQDIKEIIIKPEGRCLLPTGLFVSIPRGYEIQVRPRSGLALKQGITVLNSPGTIDSDFTGEIGIILTNQSDKLAKIVDGDRIAQLVLTKCESIDWELVDSLDETERGDGGFGHTGK